MMDFNQPYEYVGDNPHDSPWIRQNGVIFAWSESNCTYEPAWWLEEMHAINQSPLIKHLRATQSAPDPMTWKTHAVTPCKQCGAIGDRHTTECGASWSPDFVAVDPGGCAPPVIVSRDPVVVRWANMINAALFHTFMRLTKERNVLRNVGATPAHALAQELRNAGVIIDSPTTRNLQEAWSALHMIREALECHVPVKASEHLDGPTFVHEAEALAEAISEMGSRCAALRQRLAQYADDLRRNSSGGDDYPWEIMRGVADEITRHLQATK